MESTGGISGSTTAAAMPSPSVAGDSCKVFASSLFKATNYEFDPSITEEEKRFYLKAYPTVDVVRERKTHCTVCKIHIGTAPVQETGIKMHPILRVTHCNKCHDFYNSGEFSKGEDGSELYCRWCGQGGEVYCCSSCPYVFCKSCIVKNLSKGVVADIEQNENWNCFSCAPKILWPLRAQHWALMNYIEQQKKEIDALNLSESEMKLNLLKDRSRCCRLAKAKCGNMSDSIESLDSVASKRSHSSSSKKPSKHSATPSPQHATSAKRAKNNDEVVCTPDLLSMLEPDCQITVTPKTNRPSMGTPSASTPKIMSIQQTQSNYGLMHSTPKNSVPPPLVLRNTAIKIRPAAIPPVIRRTIIGPRTPNPGGNTTPVYHTINGYRIDLNSAAQQETFRLPNGKLIQVKRQGPPTSQNTSLSVNNWQQMTSPQPQRVIPQTIASRPVQITQHPYSISVQQQQSQHPQVVRYHNNMISGTTTINPLPHNGATIQVVNGQVTSQPQLQPPPQQQQQQLPVQQSGPVRPIMLRHVFPDNPIGQARSGLQDQVFNAMDICTHLTNKVHTLTNANAYKQARSFLEVKELYIHLSYLLTYAIGRFKSLQDKCLGDMRTLGFGTDADCLENGQLAADKQASDDEDNEIEIVEPKTDLINLDSDDDEPLLCSPIKTQQQFAQLKSHLAQSSPNHNANIKIKQGTSPIPTQTTNRSLLKTAAPTAISSPPMDDNMDLMSMAQSFLASMLEVEIQEGPINSPGSDSSGQKKQPRKKLTNKPNPTLLKQKALMERERLEEIKRNDQKLKMKCSVELKKAEEEFPYAKEMLEARAKENDEQDEEEDEKKEEHDQNETKEEEGGEVATTIKTGTNEEHEVTAENLEINSSTEQINEIVANNTEEHTTKFSFKIIEDAADKSLIDTEQTADSEKEEESVEIIVEIAEKSAEDLTQSQESEINDNDKEAEVKLDNSDNISQSKECSDTDEEDNIVLKNLQKNTNSSDNEEKKTANGLTTNEDTIVPEKNQTTNDETPLATAEDERMEIDEKESPQTEISTGQHDQLEANESKSNELELEIDEKIEQEVLKILEENGEIISEKTDGNEKVQPVTTEEKNMDDSIKTNKENDDELTTLNTEQQAIPKAESNDKQVADDDLPNSQKAEEIDKELVTTAGEGLPGSNEQTVETPSTPLTDAKETTTTTTSSARNGDV